MILISISSSSNPIMFLGGAGFSRKFSLQIIILTINLLAIILLSVYSGMLYTYLLLRYPKPPFNDLWEATNNSLYSLGTLHGGFVNRYLIDVNIKMVEQ